MLTIVICLLMEKTSLKLKPIIKMLTFQFNFVLEAYLVLLTLQSLLSLSLNGNVNNVSVNYDSVDKFDRLNFHEYLMNRNNVK